MARNQVFISYSHKDKRWLADLETHLKPYTRDGSVTAWSDKQIAPSSEWFDEIRSALAKAKVAVLLVTPDFLASDFIHEHELCPILKRAERGGMTILWIPVRACSYKKSAIARYQAVIELEKPLAEMKAERDRAWVRVCEAIGHAVNPRLRRRRKRSASPVAGRVKPVLKVLHGGTRSRAHRRVLRDMERAMVEGELSDSLVCPIVIRDLSAEPELEVAPNYDRRWLVTGIRLSDEYFVRVSRSAGTRDWQRDFAQVATPVLVAVTRSLKRSAESQNLVVRLCERLADRLRLQLVWPRGPDRFNDLTNAIYKACLEATSLESDEVLIVLKGLKVSGRR